MAMDEQVDPLERDHSLCVVLPGGLEKTVTVHGSKPVMDFLVSLCASCHLNPSDYTAEAVSANKSVSSLKANTPVGLLEAEKIVLKPKVTEDKLKRPYMPEATVRLLINYNRSHKTVVRVNPTLPLELLLPAVCDKCEFQVESTVLLRDAEDREPLDLSKTLNQHGLRELFARDTARPEREALETPPGTTTAAAAEPLRKEKKQKQKENSGFLSLFRRRKKKRQEAKEPPGVPGAYSSSTLPADLPKKRRAPQPPAMAAALSVPNDLSSCHLLQRSGDSTLRSTKRRAPPPPPLPPAPLQELQTHSDTTASLGLSNTLKPPTGGDASSPSSPRPSQLLSSSRSSLNHLHQAADSCLPAFRGKDLCDARAALAKVLTSSVSKGTLMKRLRKLPHGSPFTSAAPRSSVNGVFCSHFESVFTPDLPTESEWEDRTQRSGLTTFKVVPLKNLLQDQTSPNSVGSETKDKKNPGSSEGSEGLEASASHLKSTTLQDADRHSCPDTTPPQVQDENQLQDSYEVKPAEQTDGVEGTVTTEYETNQTGPQETEQSPSANGEQWSFQSAEEEASFPLPPPPVFFEEERDAPEPPSTTSNGRCEATRDGPTSVSSRCPQTASTPSRFAQAVARALQRSRRQSRSKSSAPEGSTFHTVPDGGYSTQRAACN